MPSNVRNISDEVFPGILVGDKWVACSTYALADTAVGKIQRKPQYWVTINKGCVEDKILLHILPI